MYFTKSLTVRPSMYPDGLHTGTSMMFEHLRFQGLQLLVLHQSPATVDPRKGSNFLHVQRRRHLGNIIIYLSVLSLHFQLLALLYAVWNDPTEHYLLLSIPVGQLVPHFPHRQLVLCKPFLRLEQVKCIPPTFRNPSVIGNCLFSGM